MLDLLELYTHHRSSTSVGPDFPLDLFLNIRIPLNQEADSKKLPRFAYWKKRKAESNGVQANGNSSKKHKNNRDGRPAADVAGAGSSEPRALVNPLAPTAAHDAATTKSNERSRDSTIRFMLDSQQAQDERSAVEKYFKVEMEQYEVEE